MMEAVLFTKNETKVGRYNRQRVKWNISCSIVGDEEDEEPVTYFKWEKEDLMRIYKNEKYGK